LLIRQEQPKDFPAIYDLVKMAFQTAKVSNGDEQNFVERLRAGGNYIPELALVAEEDGRMVGHIMLTATAIATAGGPRAVLLLGPLAVMLERRGRGVGARLVEEACAKARTLGHGAVVLAGDPAYYARFGFRPTADFGVHNTNGIPEANVMARELWPAALQGVGGRITLET